MTLDAINKIFEVVKTEPKENVGMTLPSGRYAEIGATRNVMAHKEYPKRVHVEVKLSPSSRYTKADFDFFIYEDGVIEMLSMVDRPKIDEEFNNDILCEFYKTLNPEWSTISGI